MIESVAVLAVTLSKGPNLHFIRATLAASSAGKCFEFGEARKPGDSLKVAQFSLSDIDKPCSWDWLAEIASAKIFHLLVLASRMN